MQPLSSICWAMILISTTKSKIKGKKGVGEKREKKAQHPRKQQSAGEDGIWKECQ